MSVATSEGQTSICLKMVEILMEGDGKGGGFQILVVLVA